MVGLYGFDGRTFPVQTSKSSSAHIWNGLVNYNGHRIARVRLLARGVGGNKALGTTLAYSDHDDVDDYGGGDDSDDT